MPNEYQQDYKKTLAYAPKLYNDPNMSKPLKKIYRALERRNLKASIENNPFDNCYILFLRRMSSLKAKQPRRPPPKIPRSVGKSKRAQLTTSSSFESPPSDNGDLLSSKLSPRSYYKALLIRKNMSNDQKETRGMFKNLARALHKFLKMLKKGCR
ncbi:hypothetical protein Tco_0153217 [Tanacetum coccineum]